MRTSDGYIAVPELRDQMLDLSQAAHAAPGTREAYLLWDLPDREADSVIHVNTRLLGSVANSLDTNLIVLTTHDNEPFEEYEIVDGAHVKTTIGPEQAPTRLVSVEISLGRSTLEQAVEYYMKETPMEADGAYGMVLSNGIFEGLHQRAGEMFGPKQAQLMRLLGGTPLIAPQWYRNR